MGRQKKGGKLLPLKKTLLLLPRKKEKVKSPNTGAAEKREIRPLPRRLHYNFKKEEGGKRPLFFGPAFKREGAIFCR